METSDVKNTYVTLNGNPNTDSQIEVPTSFHSPSLRAYPSAGQFGGRSRFRTGLVLQADLSAWYYRPVERPIQRPVQKPI